MHEAKIVWKDEYLVGNEQIDSEHKELFKIAQKANNVHNIDDPEEQINILSEVVEELKSYLGYHLKNEEQHMQELDYPLIHEHRILHKKLTDMLDFISLNLPILSIQKSGDELYNFVQKVFVKHVVTEDLKLIKFIEQNK